MDEEPVAPLGTSAPVKGIFSEYISANLTAEEFYKERKKQLARISELRERPVLVYASALSRQGPNGIEYDDRLPLFDLLSTLSGEKLDLILETPGGSAEVVEDIVEGIRAKFSFVGMIVPGYAKSAGTIMVMAGDEILMEPTSALGPIDAQVIQAGKHFSAHAFLAGLDKIKEEVDKSGKLNRAYVPILQNISPGEIQNCENILAFAEELVTDWLSKYKFKYWVKHASTDKPTTDAEKRCRATEVAKELCNHGKWKTHARSITMTDLREMRLQIKNYCDTPDLCDAIRRYYVLLRMTFDAAPDVIKIMETPNAQIIRQVGTQAAGPAILPPQGATSGVIPLQCPKCKSQLQVQANLVPNASLHEGAIPFPKDNRLVCPKCGHRIDLTQHRKMLETRIGRPIV